MIKLPFVDDAVMRNGEMCNKTKQNKNLGSTLLISYT